MIMYEPGWDLCTDCEICMAFVVVGVGDGILLDGVRELGSEIWIYWYGFCT